MMSSLNDSFFEQQATLIAENIIMAARTNGWDSLDYAKRLIIYAMKQAITKALEE